MRALTKPAYILLGLAVYFGYLIAEQPTVIKGKLIWENTSTPAANVYVYVTEGMEEDLTDKDGNFSIRTWKKLPTNLLIKYKNHPAFAVNIGDANYIHTIRLKQP